MMVLLFASAARQGNSETGLEEWFGENTDFSNQIWIAICLLLHESKFIGEVGRR